MAKYPSNQETGSDGGDNDKSNLSPRTAFERRLLTIVAAVVPTVFIALGGF